MAKANPIGPGLEVAGQISVLVDDTPCSVEFQGDRVVVKLDNFMTARALRRKVGHDVARLTAVEALLAQASLAVEIEVGGCCVARLGHGVSPNWLARALGLSPFSIESKGLWKALIGNKRTKGLSR